MDHYSLSFMVVIINFKQNIERFAIYQYHQIMNRIPPAPPGAKKNSKQPPRPPAPPKSVVRLVVEEQNNQQQPAKGEQVISGSQQTALKNEQIKSPAPFLNHPETISSIKNTVIEPVDSIPQQSSMFENREVIEEPSSAPSQISMQPPPIKKNLPPPTNKGSSKRLMGTPPPPSIKKQIRRCSPPKDVAQIQSKTQPKISLPKSKIEQIQLPKQQILHPQEQQTLLETKPTTIQAATVLPTKMSPPPPSSRSNKQISKAPSPPQIKKIDNSNLQTKVEKKQQQLNDYKSAENTILKQEEAQINKEKIKIPAKSILPSKEKKESAYQFPPIVKKQYKSAIIEGQTAKAVEGKSKLEQKLQRLQKARELMKQTEQQEQIDLQQQLSGSQGSEHYQQQILPLEKPLDTFQDRIIETDIQRNIQERWQPEIEIGVIESVSPIKSAEEPSQNYEAERIQNNQDKQTNFQHINIIGLNPDHFQKQVKQQTNRIQSQQISNVMPQGQKIGIILESKKQNPQIHELLQKYHSLKNVYLSNLRQLDELVHFQKQQEERQVEKINYLLSELSKKNEAIKNLCSSKVSSQRGEEEEQQNNRQEYAEEFTV